MTDKPMTSVAFATDNLSAAQLDGLACVVCGIDTATPGWRGVPVGMVDGCQVFACSSCVVPHATVPGTWPNGEPEDVRAAADEQGATLEERANRIVRRVLRVVQEVERRHGGEAGTVFINVFAAGIEDEITDDEALALLTEIKETGRWQRAAARLDEVGHDWTRRAE